MENNRVPDVKPPLEHIHVDKIWGHEEWVVNNEMYCGKVLTVAAGHHTSMHFHSAKHETMLCIQGSFTIIFIDSNGDRVERHLPRGHSVVIPPNTAHEIWGDSNAESNVMIEFSTQHFDSDSYRVGKPG